MNLLVLRFSAIGDVAMTVPVIKSLALARPDINIIMVSRPFAKAFFEGLADNVEFVSLDLKAERYKGMLGVEHVYQDLKALKPDMVADLHDVLRTKYARTRFRMAGIPVAHIDKHREGRKALTRKENKVLEQQPTSFEKYLKVFEELNLPQPSPREGEWLGVRSEELGVVSLVDKAPLNLPEGPSLLDKFLPSGRLGGGFIGLAPFAAHEGKIYPLDKMEDVIGMLLEKHPDLRILLFGGGKRDKEVFDRWCEKYDRVIFASEKCNGMREELAIMQQLKCMVSMDSGNMHLASLVGTPVVSIWGATHPLAGFLGWGQSEDDVVQVDLPCRPCSIYGNKPCHRGDYACLHNISPSSIVSRIERYI